MEIILNNGTKIPANQMKFTQWRELMQEFMGSGSSGASKAWDLMSCVRGPDSPSERASMGSADHKLAYSGRRARKFETTEVLRHEMFYGSIGGAARHHSATFVTVPPEEERDHFDRHIVTGATLLGLEIRIKERL